MKIFDWGKFISDGIIVHCKTEQECNDFLEKATEYGITWWNGTLLLKNNYFSKYTTKTCYRVLCRKEMICNSIDYYKQPGYKNLEWSDYMEFTKEDLRAGMLIKTSIGNGIVMPSSSKLVVTYEDKNCDFINFGDVDKVYGYSNKPCYAMSYSSFHRDLLYERPTTKEMTVEEISKALGYDVKVVKG